MKFAGPVTSYNKINDFLDIIKIHTKDGTIIQGPNPFFEDTSESVWYSS